MLWIYVPPIILIAALVALVVILGKKTSALRKTTDVFQRKSERFGTRGDEKFKKILKHFLRFLEWIIQIIRAGIKKSELGLLGVLHKVREKRLERKIPQSMSGDSLERIGDYSDTLDIVRNTKKRVVGEKRSVLPPSADSLHEEVAIRKKKELIPRRITPDLASEDKVKEEALIHRIAENPRDVEAYRELGDYYLSVGNIKDAKDSFKMVLKLRPRDLKAKNSLREIEMKMRLGS